MREPPPQTRTTWAEAQLRSALITGEIQPGAPIKAERLAEEWNISATPLREALRALDTEGLVTSQANRGWQATAVSMESSKEIYELRLRLEPPALRLSLLNANTAWREEVERTWEALKAVWHEPIDIAEVEPAHTAFHQALISASGSEYMMRLIRQLSVQSIRFRLLSTAYRGGISGAHDEHVKLYDACIAGEIDLAVELCAAHIAMTVRTLLGNAALEEVATRIEESTESDDGVKAMLRRLAEGDVESPLSAIE